MCMCACVCASSRMRSTFSTVNASSSSPADPPASPPTPLPRPPPTRHDIRRIPPLRRSSPRCSRSLHSTAARKAIPHSRTCPEMGSRSPVRPTRRPRWRLAQRRRRRWRRSGGRSRRSSRRPRRPSPNSFAGTSPRPITAPPNPHRPSQPCLVPKAACSDGYCTASLRGWPPQTDKNLPLSSKTSAAAISVA